MGVLTSALGRPGGGNGMAGDDRTERRRWNKADPRGCPCGGAAPLSTFDPLGLTLDDGEMLLAGVQRHLVRSRVAEYSTLRHRCSHCQSPAR
jgi:hypothetical protein